MRTSLSHGPHFGGWYFFPKDPVENQKAQTVVTQEASCMTLSVTDDRFFLLHTVPGDDPGVRQALKQAGISHRFQQQRYTWKEQALSLWHRLRDQLWHTLGTANRHYTQQN